jgi:gliding motility-associated transport system ATP-binding protein
MNIRVENLTKIYSTQRAVDSISFEVSAGEILGFLGPNGAGKSTTMKILTSFISWDEGRVFFGDKELNTQNSNEIKKLIGYLPENNPLYLDMPVMDYLEFCAKLVDLKPSHIKSRIREMISVCGLDREKHKLIGELSKGYRQRVGLAQALIGDPEILILDEPTTGLDPNQIVEIRKLIRSLGKQKTVILSTHILPEVEAICDRILIINEGKIVADGSADSIGQKNDDKNILIARIENGERNEIFKSLQELPRVDLVDFGGKDDSHFEVHFSGAESISEELFQMCVRNNWILTESRLKKQGLEQIFGDLTK